MVHTKADMSVHQSIFLHHLHLHQLFLIHNLHLNNFISNDHHHDNTYANHHHPRCHLQNLLYEDLFNKEEFHNPFYPEEDSEDEA